jgi:TatD DNase family protein
VTAHLIDIGINLTHDSYAHDRAQVVSAARAAGVVQMVVTASDAESAELAHGLARADPAHLASTAGLHPHHAASWNEGLRERLVRLAHAPGVVAVGECGLDFYRDLAPRADQERAFRAQIEIAIECRRPLFLHCRDAHERFVAILADYGAALPRAVAHCFTGSRAEAESCLALGLYLGITGWICDERRGLHLREVARIIPAERLMLETDGPYLLPRDLKPAPPHRRNEPKFLPHICRAVASARGESPEALAALTTSTARQFFGIASPTEIAGA